MSFLMNSFKQQIAGRLSAGVLVPVAGLLAVALVAASSALAQQTLGGITGSVTDVASSLISDATVTAVGEQTTLTREAKSSSTGSYSFVNLPIGTYTVTFSHEGFETQKFPGILVQADRTATLNASLKVGSVSTSVTVEASPLMNAVDTTNGYVMDKAQIESVPLPTGSFTGLAVLSPGVNAELSGGTGVNSGLGNAPIWANGQRDTSNSFLLNGVDASNLFNGKSTSQVASARIVNNTGEGGNPSLAAGGVVQSSASIYLSIGNALPSPAPETIEELRVNASMYDAQQGSTSGAHIDMSTASGTNVYHGSAYLHRGTDWINAAPFFFNQDPDIPDNQKVPQLHRYVLGGTFGGPIIKDKLFGFVSYQHVHVADGEIGSSFFDVPVGLTDDRSASGLAAVANAGWSDINPATFSPEVVSSGGVSPVALALFNLPAAPGEPGKYLIPNPTSHIPTFDQPDNVYLPGTARFTTDQAVADLDWNASDKDTVAFKYYYQHDPTLAPYAFSNVPGFNQHLDAGSQVFSINNTYLIKPNLSTTQTMGFLREKLYSTNDQIVTPSAVGINTFGSTYFPGVTIVDALGSAHPAGLPPAVLNIGPGAGAQGSNTGVFQNRLMPSANAIWTLGRHSVTFGGSYAYTQLNTRDRRAGTGMIATADFSQFAQGLVTTNDDFQTTTFLQGNANRYYRANQVGMYVQDKFQITPTLSLTGGIRYDWNGGLTEKNGNLFNFDPSLYKYSYNPGEGAGTIGTADNGFVVAANNPHGGTPGASATTLTGRQWGIGPRIGAAWQPKMFDSKVVVRAGTGMYYDRGELFAYFSPGYADGEVTGGPFGVNQAPPAVYAQTCIGPKSVALNFYIPTCDAATEGNLQNPFGFNYVTGPTTTTQPKAKPSDIVTNYLPNGNQIIQTSNYLDGFNSAAISQLSVQPFSMGNYGRANKLPYTINFTLDVQWQPRNDLAIEIGYVGNLGRHQIIPVPFNQPGIASPSHPINGQSYTYGYTPLDPNNFTPISLPDGTPFLTTYEGGNVDLRVPYIGYSAESETYKAAGVSSYHALQVHVDKRLSHGLQVGGSYTYSHTLDEQSAMGLFYNGNNPLNLRGGYASADFDRTHVFNFTYAYKIPSAVSESTLAGKFVDGWALDGITVIQSGQPYSVIDYTGAVGSIYYSVFDGITNPIVPLAPGCTAKTAKTGRSGAFYPSDHTDLALKASCFTLPLLNPGDLGGAIPAGDNYETTFTTGQRNIFRQSYQKRADMSLVKTMQFHDRYGVKFSLDVFNVTNTTSFDIPVDNVSQNQNYNNEPAAGQTALPTGCQADGTQSNTSFYNCPTKLGIVNKAIGSPRQVQFSLGLSF